jgi:hypothetical protein
MVGQLSSKVTMGYLQTSARPSTAPVMPLGATTAPAWLSIAAWTGAGLLLWYLIRTKKWRPI